MTLREPKRLRCLRDHQILETPHEVCFDRLVEVTSSILDMPIVMLGFLDERRLWLKACVGLEAEEIPRAVALCTHVVEARQSLFVEDVREDARFKDNILVTQAPGIRTYAGAPLFTSEGYVLGTLCVIDNNTSRPLRPRDLTILEELARCAVAHLERRRALHALKSTRDEARLTHHPWVSHLNHKLRTPLGAILGYAELALEEHALDSKVRSDLESIFGASQEMLDVLESLEASKRGTNEAE